jgi:ribosomal protein L44E
MIARHHLSKNTVEAMYYCNKCEKSTMHDVSNGHKGACQECAKRRDERVRQEPVAVQGGLF